VNQPWIICSCLSRKISWPFFGPISYIYNIILKYESNLKAPKSCWFPAYLHVTARRSFAPRARPCGFSAQHATKSPWTLQSVISLDVQRHVCRTWIVWMVFAQILIFTRSSMGQNTDQKTWVVARHCVQVTFILSTASTLRISINHNWCTILLVLLLVLKPRFKLLAFRLWFWMSTSWP